MSDLSNVARPYAQAVFEMARDADDLAGWSDQLELLGTIAADPAMGNLLQNPAFTDAQQIEVILGVAGEQLSEGGRNLVKLLVENGRVPALPDMAQIYAARRAEAESVVEAVLITANAVGESHQQEFSKALQKRLGRNVSLHFKVDESLIGGAVIRSGDWVIDGSVKAQLAQLENALAA